MPSTSSNAILTEAVTDGRVVQFRYAKGDGRYIEPRTVVPEKISEKLIVGMDPDRNDYRAYRLDRIMGEVSFA